jgi:hypothetical protein
MVSTGRVFIRRRRVWLAWYPLRGRHCMFGQSATRGDGWHFHAALGPLYLGLGPGTPLP